MQNKTLMTYSLLSHLKETRSSEYSSLVELFFPIVKKAIVEYASEKSESVVKGKSIVELQKKIIDFFGIDIPISVLGFILNQISVEIADEQTFVYYKDQSFIINTFVFSDINEEIAQEFNNIEILKNDFKAYCLENNHVFDFDELITFVCSQKVELFSDKNTSEFDFKYHIPKYIAAKFNDEKIFKAISDIYLGSLISSYFEYNIKTPIANTELLIDTNFYISLIDLNTEEAYHTCKQLFEFCKKLGFKFSILYCTIDQIKSLLSRRISDFANKEIGLIDEADVFAACIRRNLDKTQLERIKDNVDKTIRELNIDIIYEARIPDLIKKARNSDKYKEFLQVRKNQQLSALNDTIAHFYVLKKRGENIEEFSDVKCWFLNNTFHTDYYSGLGHKLHERFKISASELLSLLWLSNPSQEKIDINTLSKGGLATYIAKYKQKKIPSTQVIRDINNRSKRALAQGLIEEKDVYSLSIRMAEGQLANGEAAKIVELPDEDFIEMVRELSHKDNEIIDRIKEQSNIIKNQDDKLKSLERSISKTQFDTAIERYNTRRDKYIENELAIRKVKTINIAWSYIMLVLIMVILWLINNLALKLIGPILSTIVPLILFVSTLFIRFIDHKNVLDCLRYLFSGSYKRFKTKVWHAELADTYKTIEPLPLKDDHIEF